MSFGHFATLFSNINDYKIFINEISFMRIVRVIKMTINQLNYEEYQDKQDKMCV